MPAVKRGRRRIRDYVTFGKEQYSNSPIPQPQMNWDMIRRAKLKCIGCPRFDWLNGGCGLYKLPNECEL